MGFDTKTGCYKDSKNNIEKVADKYDVKKTKDAPKTMNEIKEIFRQKHSL